MGREEVKAPGRQEVESDRVESDREESDRVEAGQVESDREESDRAEAGQVEPDREEMAGRQEVEALRARIRQLEDEAGRDQQFHEDLATLLEIGSLLTLADTPDELCRQAVELGRSRLRLGRLGIWFFNPDGLAIQGSFGTDEEGRTRDERGCCVTLRSDVRASLRFTPVPEITQVDDTDLTDHCNEKVGRGSLLWAPLSDGRRSIGVIFADNLLEGRPYERHQPSILKRYAVMLSHLYAVKKAEAQLRASESLYRGLVGVCPDGIVVTDADGVIRQANVQFCRLHGFDRTEEVIGLNALDLVVPEDRDAARRYRLDVAAGLTRGLHECQLRRRDGTEFPAEVGVAKLSEGHADSSLWISVARDITERKRAQDGLRQERNLLRTLIDALPDHIWIKDAQSRFVVANKAVVREFGKKCMEEVIGRTDADFFPAKQAAGYLAEEQEVIRTGRPIRDREVCVVGSGGVERWGLTSKIPLSNEAGVVTGLVGCVRDVTRERRLLQTLEAAEARYRMTFAAMLDPLHLVDRDLRIVLSNEALRSFVKESGSPAPEAAGLCGRCFRFCRIMSLTSTVWCSRPARRW